MTVGEIIGEAIDIPKLAASKKIAGYDQRAAGTGWIKYRACKPLST